MAQRLPFKIENHIHWILWAIIVAAIVIAAVEPRKSLAAAEGTIDHIEYGEVDPGSNYGPTHYDRYHDRATGDEIICFSGYRRLSCFPTGRNWK